MTRTEELVTALLKELGEDPGREGLHSTPGRMARALQFMTTGYAEDPRQILMQAVFDESYDEMLIVRDIDFYSMCEHHMLPFFGKAHIAYIPNGRVLGLSKLARVTDVFARRLQVQERLTQQILVAMQTLLGTEDVAVTISAVHYCVKARGVKDGNSSTRTTSLGGVFKSDPASRAEFLS